MTLTAGIIEQLSCGTLDTALDTLLYTLLDTNVGHPANFKLPKVLCASASMPDTRNFTTKTGGARDDNMYYYFYVTLRWF